MEDQKSLQAIVAATLESIRGRSFSERNPELGKMVNCSVCDSRHRSSQVCVRKHKYLHTEAEVDNDGKTIGTPSDVFAVIDRPARPKGRRRPRPNHSHFSIIEIAKDIYGRGTSYDGNTPEDVAKLQEVRVEAVREWKRRRRAAAKRKRRQQDVSRRINQGLLPGGFRP
jgi:hypothetical protein